jgi:hypothetical protein
MWKVRTLCIQNRQRWMSSDCSRIIETRRRRARWNTIDALFNGVLLRNEATGTDTAIMLKSLMCTLPSVSHANNRSCHSLDLLGRTINRTAERSRCATFKSRRRASEYYEARKSAGFMKTDRYLMVMWTDLKRSLSSRGEVQKKEQSDRE